MFLRKGVLTICSKFTGEQPCWSVISIKLLCNFIEITLRNECSPVNLLHIFRTPFLKNTSGRLLINNITVSWIDPVMSKVKVQEEPGTIEHQKIFKVLTDIVWALAWQGFPYRGDGNKKDLVIFTRLHHWSLDSGQFSLSWEDTQECDLIKYHI